MQRVLFVCTGNTCRSVFAEYIARARFGTFIQATSAGVQPGSPADTTNAVYTMKQVRIDAGGHIPRDVRQINLADFDQIVAMDGDVAREFKALFPDCPVDKLVTWNIQDPYGEDLAEYDRCARKVYSQLKKLVAPGPVSTST